MPSALPVRVLCGRERRAADGDAPAADRIEADDRLGELGAPCAHQAEEPEHLAGPRLEATCP